jgi:nifR3 family TIM-barrel protein
MLAPMEGVTHPEFRAVMAERGGLGAVCTEFVRVGRVKMRPAALRREVVKVPGVPLSVQVMGNHADHMAEAAAVVSEAGADVIDVNLGCPMPRIVRKGVGAAMLNDLDLLHQVLCRMRARTPVLLSAKIRAGFDDSEGVVRIGRVIEEAGVDFLVVHPRRRCDYYEGVADWRIIRELRAALSIPVVGNGDAWYAADALRMERETGCDAVMIGRPALRNPWVFQQIDALRTGRRPPRPSGEDLVAYLDEVRRRYDGRFGRPIGRMKELLRYIGRAVDDGRQFLRHVLRLGDLDEIMRSCERSLASLEPHQLDLDAEGSLGLERSGSCLPSRDAA